MPSARNPIVLGAFLAAGIVIGQVVTRTLDWLEFRPALAADGGAPRVVLPPDDSSPRGSVGGDVFARLSEQYDRRYAEIDRTFSDVSQAVAPSVVHIVARKLAPHVDQDTGSRFIEETGSGVLVRIEGQAPVYVLTNHHVVADSRTQDITITLYDGRVLQPLQSWSDPKADVAVMELGRDDLPAARLGDSDQAIVGTWVLAFGSPFGLTHSVSQGIVSARNRHDEEFEDQGIQNQDFIQTDAAINPGNSGGPLVNLKGEVIGINSSIATLHGGGEGVGFSIPINMARWIVSQLVSNHRVTRGALGVRLQDLAHLTALDLGLDRPRGARILSVETPSPAAEAGMQSGDVVLKFNGIEVLDINHLINLVSMAPIGQAVELVIWRDRSTQPMRVTIADREAIQPTVDAAPASLHRPAHSATEPARGGEVRP
jgi:serine protease Do